MFRPATVQAISGRKTAGHCFGVTLCLVPGSATVAAATQTGNLQTEERHIRQRHVVQWTKEGVRSSHLLIDLSLTNKRDSEREVKRMNRGRLKSQVD